MATFEIQCKSCGAKLSAGVGLIGRTVNCPKCNNPLIVTVPPEDIELAKTISVNTVDGQVAYAEPPLQRRRYRPATDKQKAFAVDLGIDFAPDINAHDISILIDKALDHEYETDKDKIELHLKTLNQCSEDDLLAELTKRGSRAFVVSWPVNQDFAERTEWHINGGEGVTAEIIDFVLVQLLYAKAKQAGVPSHDITRFIDFLAQCSKEPV
ncbi:MAG TPA: hypothetical protein VFE46_10650 [Pirellulales bacterium]|jgi:hypothetical protein|nr:hypothetical protein [Pirellulales bacterium]